MSESETFVEDAVETIESPIPAGADFEAERIDPLAIPTATAEAEEEYWIGLKDGADHDFVTAGGMDFPKFIGQNAVDAKGNSLGSSTRGKRVMLPPSRVKAIKTAIAKKIIRQIAEGRCALLTVEGPNFRFRNDDRPLGRYLWMVKVRPTMPIDWMESDPPSMCA